MVKLTSIIVAGMLAFTATMTASVGQDPGLPVIEHNGEDCYFYTVKGNESVFGILSRFGWDENTFMAYNPKAAQLKKGQIVYYPLPQVQLPAETETGIQPPLPATTVQTPPELPSAAEVAAADIPTSEPLIYVVKEGDTLYSLARQYNVTVNELFSINPGLSETSLTKGLRIKIIPGRQGRFMRTIPVKEKKMTGKENYKVQEGDTWESLAQACGVSVGVLHAVNDTELLPRPGKKVSLPVVTDTVIYRTVEIIDSLENTAEGRQIIYDRAHGVIPASTPMTLDITLLTGTSSDGKNRDLEFVRGFLLAIDRNKPQGYKLNLHVRCADPATLSIESLAADSVISTSSMIITTYDKDFPAPLGKFAATRGIKVINTFDAKSDLYLTSPDVVQLLTPSAEFYDACADYLLASKPDSKYIFMADDDADGECVSLILLERLIRDSRSYETVESYAALADYQFDPTQSYVIVSDLNKRSDISKFLNALERSIDNNPGARISVVGRPTWIVYADALKTKLQKCDTYIPSRFFLDSTQGEVTAFEKAYEAAFGSAPLKSFPGYAAMGYDVAEYFINAFVSGRGDISDADSSTDALQIDIRMSRPEVWSGMLNENVYLIHFTPYNTIDKLRL